MKSIYLIGKSRGKNNIAIIDLGNGFYDAMSAQDGVGRAFRGTLEQVSMWVRSQALFGLGDAYSGKGAITHAEMANRIKHKSGADVLEIN